VLQGIWFSGVNAYARLLIRNNSGKELALGRMNLQWFKKNGTNYNLFACYVTGFPILAAGKETTIVYVTRAVNAQDSDTFSFSMHDRLEKTTLEFPISGELYNKEMARHQR
jgi:hypothetical protein